MESRNRWIALGALVLITASFRPWSAVRTAVDLDGEWVKQVVGRNAWHASHIWAAGVAASLAAVAVWFGLLQRATQRARRLLASLLLLLAIALVAQVHPHRAGTLTFSRIIVRTDGHGNVISGNGARISLKDLHSAGVEPAQRVALVTLVLMLGLIVLSPSSTGESTDR